MERRPVKAVSTVEARASPESEERAVRGSGHRFQGSNPRVRTLVVRFEAKALRSFSLCGSRKKGLPRKAIWKRTTTLLPGRSLAGGRFGEEWVAQARRFQGARGLAGSRKVSGVSFTRYVAMMSQDSTHLTPFSLSESPRRSNNILCQPQYLVCAMILLLYLVLI